MKRTCLSIISALILGFTYSSALFAQEQNPNLKVFENELVLMEASTSKPENLAAFYTGRGFSQEAVHEITQTCFVTVHIVNKSDDITWLTLDDWVFTSVSGETINKIRRTDWKPVWQRINMKKAHQATFSWTQLPDERDLHPEEQARGNVILPWQTQPFKLVATLRTRPDRSGTPVIATIENLQCRK